MSQSSTTETELAYEANRRYWDTDASVNQIAEEMGLSKSSLYGVIDHLGTGLACPECSSELVFANRTARDRGMVSCSRCTFEGLADEILDEVEGADPGAATAEHGGAEGQTPSARVIAGTALLGVAAGLALATLFRRS